jgi:hypothetical protein
VFLSSIDIAYARKIKGIEYGFKVDREGIPRVIAAVSPRNAIRNVQNIYV